MKTSSEKAPDSLELSDIGDRNQIFAPLQDQ